MRSIIVGYGEIGKSLYNVLLKHGKDNIGVIDIDTRSIPFGERPDILHICFGYSDDFIQQVKEYQQKILPLYTVIHSTVPLGTCVEIGREVIHSPCRGLHPNLEEGLLTFPKFIGGKNASAVADYFRRAGMKVIIYDKAETTEALKLFDTEYYRVCIEFALRVKNYCDSYGLNFSEVYTIANQTYNEGYIKLGMPEVVRPVLQPIMKPIGGHCLMPNKKLVEMSEVSNEK